MANQTGYTQVPAGVLAFYDRNLLENATPAEVHDKWGQQRTIPKNNSDSIKFRRYAQLAIALTALTEGVTPAGTQLSVTDVTAKLLQYGDFTILTDKVSLMVEDKVVAEATELLGEQAGLTIDTITRNYLMAGTGVIYAAGVAGRASVDTPITAVELKAAIKLLKGNNAKMFSKVIEGSVKVNTFPIRPSFVGIVHTDTTAILEDIDGFKGTEEYASQRLIDINEAGSYKNIRFVETTNAAVFTGAGAGSKDVYGSLIMGKNAYGVISLRGQKNIQTIVKPLGSAGTADPLNQRASVGWKAWTVTKILNDDWLVRVESTEV